MELRPGLKPDLKLDLKLEWLESFAAFARERSFTRAAKALHLSQPALFVQVKKLGEALGVALYRRQGQRLTLTEGGERVAAFAREIQERTGELTLGLAADRGADPVSLCAGEGAYLYLLGEGIRRFLARPGAQLSLLTRDREGALAAVRGGEAQVGVAALDVVPGDLDARPLTDVGLALIAPASHPLAKKKRLRLADLAGARLVVPGPDRPHRAVITRALRDAGAPWEVAVEANGWALMLRFVELGVGLAIVNACCRAPRGLVSRPLTELPRQRYYVLQRRRASRSARPAGAADRLVEALLATGDAWRR